MWQLRRGKIQECCKEALWQPNHKKRMVSGQTREVLKHTIATTIKKVQRKMKIRIHWTSSGSPFWFRPVCFCFVSSESCTTQACEFESKRLWQGPSTRLSRRLIFSWAGGQRPGTQLQITARSPNGYNIEVKLAYICIRSHTVYLSITRGNTLEQIS